ncbi:DeoR family transcriptional regulator [Lysinibacillus sphaericus]|uniref:DeoR family transcriptional regulator n=3 Tax=Lysinibacillus TaxID=400634 RepID=A0A2S0K030_LYSSH|nr:MULTISPECIES: hypothetical protein [Lysinibacillus]AHN22022.1 DeoR family transcriptional regulator [Lysinibacillus varians]AVK96753.1 DeoR family transcriptional regulator [Lysinibacillus sphaericus]MED4545789.1 DeoR family transcriptional regulator [Lysinibacillus sphaericus]TKI16655.1 DeoR family transcriptional regulator [Lysinibacillus sphaericus]TKI50680.1 DeoR family transcriptional regulator [Lysinibacillus tabacifolii]
MSTTTNTLIASVTSEQNPQSGQKHRSSGNFSTEGLPEGTTTLLWKVEGGGDSNAIKFNVMQDKSAATDPVIFKGILSGNRTDAKSIRSLYIADPSGATSSFVVHVYAVN